ncbi:MAG: hypothetical protein HDT21_09175, partial [Ruminococcus sp.]|nr:hypothetical protein [Ruminococcus sp.]
ACGRGEGSFALCGARPKAPPLDFASWAQLDQLMSAASPPKGLLHSAWWAKPKFFKKYRAAVFPLPDITIY